MGMRKQQTRVYDFPSWWRGRQCLEFHSGIWVNVQRPVLLWSLDSVSCLFCGNLCNHFFWQFCQVCGDLWTASACMPLPRHCPHGCRLWYCYMIRSWLTPFMFNCFLSSSMFLFQMGLGKVGRTSMIDGRLFQQHEAVRFCRGPWGLFLFAFSLHRALAKSEQMKSCISRFIWKLS